MDCVLCKQAITDGQHIKSIEDDFATYSYTAHHTCWIKYKQWMQIRRDKAWIIFHSLKDPHLRYRRTYYDAPDLEYFFEDDFERNEVYPEMIPPEEYWVRSYNPQNPDNPNYNHPGSHGSNIDWYGTQGTARWEVEPV